MRTLRPHSRRAFLGGIGLLGLTGCVATTQRLTTGEPPTLAHASGSGMPNPLNNHAIHLGNILKGDVDPSAINGFDPTALLTDFDYDTVSTLPNGQTLRSYDIYATDKLIEIAPGLTFPAWVYNGRVPGPTLRCTQGDRIRVTLTNGSSHAHSIHFHGFHPAAMDGVTPVQSGETTVYEFDAEPFGLHVYHCHVPPFMRHIHKGLYGVFIIDPPTPRPPAKELVMVMTAFDTNFDGENEIYAVNTVGFHYTKHPIPLKINELVRVYLSNFTEFDPINSFHIHANLFHVYRTGTRLEPDEYTDLVMLCQAERHILEFTYTQPGQYMFHAHQSEFNQLGWMGIFDVSDTGVAGAPFEAAARMGICSLV
jgi:FtsP/CotA-like multicopper oxidase with cupredoxin domain